MADVIIREGEDLTLEFDWEQDDGTAINIDGHAACMNIRPSATSATVYLKATTANGKISISGNSLTVSVPASETKTLDFDNGVLDVKLTSPQNEVFYWPIITVSFRRSVSRDCD